MVPINLSPSNYLNLNLVLTFCSISPPSCWLNTTANPQRRRCDWFAVLWCFAVFIHSTCNCVCSTLLLPRDERLLF